MLRMLSIVLALSAPGSVMAQTAPATSAATSTPADAPNAIPRIIPTAEFAKQPLFTGPVLSPDGKRMLARFNVRGKERIGVHSFEGQPIKLLSVPEKNDLRWYRWAGNNRVLISVAKTVPYFDDEAVMTRLVMLDLTTGQSQFIGSKYEGLEGDDVLYVDPSGEWILLSFQKSVFDYPSVSRVELATNKITTVVPDREPIWEWYADNKGVVRTGIGFDDTGWTYFYRSNESERFRQIGKARYDAEKDDAIFDVSRIVNGSDDGYILSSEKTGRDALYRFNFATRQTGELLFESKTNDIDDATLNDDNSIRAVYYADERSRVVWFDPILKKHQSDIDAALKGKENWIVSTAVDKSAMLIWTGSSHDPGSYYNYRPEAGVMDRVAKVSDTLRRSELAPMQYVTYKARDGLEIKAYLTLPLGRDPKNLPLIIMPHGGPYGIRDVSDYNPEVQLLANRGYVVLQPNFRGSGGYGKAHYTKGEGQMGRAMQDDLDDGMDWLAKQGTIDPKRVCLYGASYGGYAALWGATRNPERYRCAASLAGISDLQRMLKYDSAFFGSRKGYKKWQKTVKGEDSFDLRTVSALYGIDKLRVPILLGHGEDDQTVPVKQSTLYADALKKAGKPVEIKTYPGEGHGLSDSANEQDWLDRLEAFLKKYNPA